ncbi:MAG: PAS domain-containing protein [Caulobacteraceae bacterium]
MDKIIITDMAQATRESGAISATERRLTLAMEAAGAGVFELDRGARHFWCSPEFVRLLGRTMTEAETFADQWPIYHPDDVARVREVIAAAAAANADDVVFEARLVQPDGSARWTEWRIKVKRRPQGAFSVVGFAFDISQRKQQEAELLETRRVANANAERLHLAMASARAGVFEIDFAQRTFWCSPELEHLVGRRLSFEETCKPVWSVCHPDDHARVIETIMNNQGPILQSVQWRLVRPSGEVRWVETNGSAHFAPNGRIDRVVGVMVDVDDRKRQEAELLESRHAAQANAERLNVAMAAARAGAFETNFTTRTFWSSPEFEQIVGRALTFEEAAAPDWPVIHPEDRQRVFDSITSQTGSMLPLVEWRVLLPTGEVRWIESNGRIFRSPDGSIDRITGTVMDIDQRKRQEAALDESRAEAQDNSERLTLAMSSAGAGVFEIDEPSRSFWCSPEFEIIAGRRLKFEEVNRPAWTICHPDDADRLNSLIRAARGGALQPLEWRLVRPDGEVRWVQTTGRTYLGADGAVKRVVGIIVDIHERKRQALILEEARQAVETTAERLELALDAVQAGVFETDIAKQTFWCSPEFIDIIGQTFTFEESHGGAWPVIHPDDRALWAAPPEDGQAGKIEFRIVLPSGWIRWIESRAVFHRDAEGELLKVTGLVLDIDERKRQELNLIEAERAASAAAEAKSQFLANMSHEIRTPMNGVLGILGLLNKEQLSDEARQMVAEAEGCGQMLAQLLNDVIDFSRINAGRLELSPEPTDVAAVLRSVTELLRPQAEGKSLELTTRIEGGDGWAMIDPVRLRQGLFNLIGNAIKFTLEGRVEARLTISEEGPGQKRLRFEIEDSGVGIPASVQATLFQRFQQADGSTARRFGGSGLGLVITRALAEMMDGEVGFTSVEGKGSTFWLDVPAPAAERTSTAEECLAGLEGLNILVVEDNATNRLVATKILEGLGAQVTTADDGVLGVEAVMAMTFDLVLMDVQMPRMDGVEATRTIRALDGPVSRVPIVGLTANVMLHQWQEYREAGMDGVASKPISPRALLTEIARVISEVDEAVAA